MGCSICDIFFFLTVFLVVGFLVVEVFFRLFWFGLVGWFLGFFCLFEFWGFFF